jgi:hypothetical protein
MRCLLCHSNGHIRDVYFHVIKRKEVHKSQLLATVQILQTG